MQIIISSIHKTFKVPIKQSGLKESFKYLFKRDYKQVKAIKDLSFNIDRGELIGYLGPNGAGKSTTLKMLTGIMTPDAGEITVDGIVPYQSRVQNASKIGVVFGQKSQLWWDLPLRDSFDLIKAIYRIPDDVYQRQYHLLVEGLAIDNYIDQPVRMLSLGQRMRAELVVSLLHKPDILFLDEPTIGLDATSKLTVRKFIKHLNEVYKTTVILTTHDMDDIESLAQRVLVIDHGVLGFDGTLDTLRKKVDNQKLIKIDYRGRAEFESSPLITLQEQREGRAVFSFVPEMIGAHDVINWVTGQCQLVDLVVENPPIEEIVAKLYGGHYE